MTSWIKGAVLAVAAVAIAGCSDSADDRKLRGQVIGGATGAAVGSMFGGGSGKAVAIGAGAVMGTIVGGHLAED